LYIKTYLKKTINLEGMSNQPKVKYIGIARMSDTRLLASFSSDKKVLESFKAEAKTILDKLQDTYLKAGERQKIRTSNGAWFSSCDAKDIFYLALTDSSYPERYAYTLIDDVATEIKTLRDYEQESPAKVESYAKAFVPNLIDKYSDLDNLDNLIATQNKVNQVKDIMSDTINRALENRETFDDLDRKSGNLNNMARDFHSGSAALASKMRDRKRKLIIYSVIAVLVFIILYFIIA